MTGVVIAEFPPGRHQRLGLGRDVLFIQWQGEIHKYSFIFPQRKHVPTISNFQGVSFQAQHNLIHIFIPSCQFHHKNHNTLYDAVSHATCKNLDNLATFAP